MMCGLDQVRKLDFYFQSLGGAEVVVGRENQLGSAGAGGDADLVKEDGGLVDVDGVRLSCAEERNAAADVAGKGLNVFEGRHFGLAKACCARKFLEVEFGVAGDDGEAVEILSAGDQQGLEDLL